MGVIRHIGDEIVQCLNAGLKYSEIQKKIKEDTGISCSKGTIGYHAKKHGLENKGHHLLIVPEDIQEEIYEYCKGHTNVEAVKYFELSLSTIKKYKKGQKNKATKA